MLNQEKVWNSWNWYFVNMEVNLFFTEIFFFKWMIFRRAFYGVSSKFALELVNPKWRICTSEAILSIKFFFSGQLSQ